MLALFVLLTCCSLLSVSGQCIQTQAGPITLDSFTGDCPGGLSLTSTGDSVTVSNSAITAPSVTINAATSVRFDRSTVDVTGPWSVNAGAASEVFLSTLVVRDLLSFTSLSTTPEAALTLDRATFTASGAGALALDLTSTSESSTGLLVLTAVVFPPLELRVASQGAGMDYSASVEFTGGVRANLTCTNPTPVLPGFRATGNVLFTGCSASFVSTQAFETGMSWLGLFFITDSVLALDSSAACTGLNLGQQGNNCTVLRSSVTLSNLLTGDCEGLSAINRLVVDQGSSFLLDSAHRGTTTAPFTYLELHVLQGSQMVLKNVCPLGTGVSRALLFPTPVRADPSSSLRLEGEGLTGVMVYNQHLHVDIRGTATSTASDAVGVSFEQATLTDCTVVGLASATGPAPTVRGCFFGASGGQITDSTLLCNATGANAGLLEGARATTAYSLSGLSLEGHCDRMGCAGLRIDAVWTSTGPTTLTAPILVIGPSQGLAFGARNDASTLTLRVNAIESAGPALSLLQAGTQLDVGLLSGATPPLHSNGAYFSLDAPSALYQAPWDIVEGVLSFTGTHTFPQPLTGANLTLTAGSRVVLQDDLRSPSVQGTGALVLDRTLVNGEGPPSALVDQLPASNVRLLLDGSLGPSSDRFVILQSNDTLAGKVLDDATGQTLTDGGTFNTAPELFSRFLSSPSPQLLVFTSTPPTTSPDEATVQCDGSSCDVCLNVLANDVSAFPFVAGDLVTPAGLEGDFTLDAAGQMCYSRAGPRVPGDYPIVVTYQAEDGPPGAKSPPTDVTFDLASPSPSASPSVSPSSSASPSVSLSSSASVTGSPSASPTPSLSPAASPSASPSPSVSSSFVPSPSSSASPSVSPSASPTRTGLLSPSSSPSASASSSGSLSAGATPSSSLSSSVSLSVGATPSSSLSLSASRARSIGIDSPLPESPSSSPSVSPSSSSSLSVGATPSASLSSSLSVGASPSASLSVAESATPSLDAGGLLPPVVNPPPSRPPSPSNSASPHGGPASGPVPSPTPLPTYTPRSSRLGELLPDCFTSTPTNEVFCNTTLVVDTEVRAPNGQPIRISRPSAPIIDASTLDDVDSLIVNVTLAEDGEGLGLGGNVEICLRPLTTDREHCLGYLDESRSPPVWTCEDECVQSRGGLVCGNTDHFTAFALLLMADLPHGRSPCSAFTGYVTGGPYGDLILILSTTAFMVVLGACLCLAVTNIPYVRAIILGSEGDRIARSRVARRTMSKWLVDTDSSSGSGSASDELISSTSKLIPPC